MPIRLGPLLVLALAGAFSPMPAMAGRGGPLDSEELGEDDSWSYVFANAGTYSYHCAPHPWMKGTVVVQASDVSRPAPMNVSIVGFTFKPFELVVGLGTTVTWTNLDQAVHTVTSDEEPNPGGIQKWQVVLGIVSLVGIVFLMAHLLRRKPQPPA